MIIQEYLNVEDEDLPSDILWINQIHLTSIHKSYIYCADAIIYGLLATPLHETKVDAEI